MGEVRRRGTGTEVGRIHAAVTAGTVGGGGFFDQWQRDMLRGRDTSSQGATSATSYGTLEQYENSGTGSISVDDLPAGWYVVEARHRLVYNVDCTDQYHRVDVGSKLGDNGGAQATAGLPLVCSNTTMVYVDVAGGSITATPTLLGGPGAGAVTVDETTILATRIAS